MGGALYDLSGCAPGVAASFKNLRTCLGECAQAFSTEVSAVGLRDAIGLRRTRRQTVPGNSQQRPIDSCRSAVPLAWVGI